MVSKIDLHSHSTCSDGTNTPSELLARVAQVGIKLFALTDHDTVAGIDEAGRAANQLGVRLINGVEISCTHTLSGGYGKNAKIDKIIHVVALNFGDVEQMNQALQAVQDSRHQRGEAMVQNLAKLLHEQEVMSEQDLYQKLWQAILQKANHNPKAVGRAHIAQVLYEFGMVSSVQSAFDKYLADNKPAYVPIQTLTMAETIELIHRCGGVAVLAHPTRYKLSSTRIQRLIADFASMGGDGCELPNNEPMSLVDMVSRAIAKHELLVSLGSDFHGANMPWRKLGSTAKIRPEQTGVWTTFGLDESLLLSLS